jgi:hypothetical protein
MTLKAGCLFVILDVIRLRVVAPCFVALNLRKVVIGLSTKLEYIFQILTINQIWTASGHHFV